MKITAVFVAAFVAMTWSQEAEGFGNKLQCPPTFRIPTFQNPMRDMDDDDLGRRNRFPGRRVGGGTRDEDDDDLGGFGWGTVISGIVDDLRRPVADGTCWSGGVNRCRRLRQGRRLRGWRDIDVAGKHFLIRHGGTIRRGVDDILRVKPFLDEDEDDNIGWNQNLGGGPFRKNPRDSWGQWRL